MSRKMHKPKMMKKALLFAAMSLLFTRLEAQIISNITAPEMGEMGQYSEWKKAGVSFEDNTTAEIEYRVALVDKKGIGCHYSLEVKNLSDIKLKIRMKSNYYDKLVKGYYGDEIEESLKPGKTVQGRFVGQGCKKEKGVEQEDYEQCMACGLSLLIEVTK